MLVLSTNSGLGYPSSFIQRHTGTRLDTSSNSSGICTEANPIGF